MFFKNIYLDSWFEDEFARRMIKSVDGAVVLGDGLIQSRVLGKIAPTQLSGGVKTLLLIHNMPDECSTPRCAATTVPGGFSRWQKTGILPSTFII